MKHQPNFLFFPIIDRTSRALRKSICFDNIFNHRKNNCSIIRTTKRGPTIQIRIRFYIYKISFCSKIGMMLAVIFVLCARYKGHCRIKCSVFSLPVVQLQISLLVSWKLCRFCGLSEDLDQLTAVNTK